MVTITAVVDDNDPGNLIVDWIGLVTGSLDGSAHAVKGVPSDMMVHAVGTPDTSTVTMQGSLDDGTNWFTLVDPGGSNVAFTAAGMMAIRDRPPLIRPLMTSAGGTSDMDVRLVISRSMVL